ncbi:glutathione S-transferase [Yoonia sp. SS1-5]|uniref:Glutathione S-transferase n=1 Tax=Yoonia rhodophyticola TaxID=3137370 RepID=A0AAN0NKZ0_9RHOB
MKLLMSPPSPFVRKVRVVLRETGLIDTIEEVAVTTTPLASDPDVSAANPLAKIPVLIRDDGPAIYDSRVINRFLNTHAQANLYPEGRLWEILTLEATADAIMEAAVGMTYEMRYREAAAQSPAWLDAQWAKVDRATRAISTRWMSHLSGPLNIGQIGVACALSYLDLRHDARGWRAGNDTLAAWHAAFAQRQSMLDTAVS